MRRVLTILLVSIAVVIGLKGLVLLLEPRLAFFPFSGEQATPAERGIAHTTLAILTKDDERLTAWHLRRADARARVLYFHGNGGNLSLWLPALATLHRRGFDVVALDYRGYGTSSGSPTEKGLYLDAEAAVQALDGLVPAPEPLIYWGRSLGAAIAAYASTVRKPDGLVLESGFPDVGSLFSRNPVFGPLSLLATYRFPTAEWLNGFDRPVLVMHGELDSVVPYRQGQRLFDRLGGNKRFVTIRNADHNDMFEAGDDAYWSPIQEFVENVAQR